MKFKVLAVSLALIQSQFIYAQPSVEDEVRDSWIVVLKDEVEKRNVRSMARAMAADSRGKLKFVYKNSIKGFAIKAPRQAIEKLLQNNPMIDYIESDGVAYASAKPPGKGKDTTNDGGGDSNPPPQITPWGISYVTNGQSAVTPFLARAWIIDTGIDMDHPDLNVDQGLCGNFVSRGKSTCDDGNGHGTHVAGTIAAIDNSEGVIGVAPGATVVSVRVLDNNGSGSYSGVIAGVDMVAQYSGPDDVANMSLGGPASDALDAAVKAAAQKVKFVIAAGNSNADAANYSPARIKDEPNVYTISAVASNNSLATFSNFGAVIDYAAPGVGIESTWKGGGYNTISGTSMAAPHVAGLLISGGIATSGLELVNDDKDDSQESIARR